MSANNRGKGLCIELAINIFGVALAYWIDYGMSFVNNESQFRFPLGFQIFFAILTFAGIVFLPESPRWLVAHDRHDDAKRIIWAVQPNAKEIDVNGPKVSHDLHVIQRAIIEEREAASLGSYKALFTNGKQKFFYRTMLGIGGQFMQQLSGINLITYVCLSIFSSINAFKEFSSNILCRLVRSCYLSNLGWSISQPLSSVGRLQRHCLLDLLVGPYLGH